MALEPLSNETLDKIRGALKIEYFSRPHAVLVDQGDFGTVFTYIPLFPKEYLLLPIELQRYVYCVAKGRYGLVAFVPKSFEFRGDGEMTGVSEVYDDFGNLREMSYTIDDQEPRKLENSVRREQLQVFAKKKKIPVKKVIRSSS